MPPVTRYTQLFHYFSIHDYALDSRRWFLDLLLRSLLKPSLINACPSGSSRKLKNRRLDHFFGLRILKNERLKALHGFR